MNKIFNRKGFTTVELVIVIAVIAILATALIPTFAGLIDSANDTKYMQEARQAFNDYMLKDPAAASSATYYIETSGETYYKVTEGKFSTEKVAAPTDSDTTPVLYVGGPCTAPTTVDAGAHGTADAKGNCPTCGETISSTEG